MISTMRSRGLIAALDVILLGAEADAHIDTIGASR